MSRDCPTLKTFSPTQRWGGFFVRFERTYYKRNKHVSANADPDFFKQPADLKASRRPKSPGDVYLRATAVSTAEQFIDKIVKALSRTK
jgi:hypothetical protein